MTAPSNTAGATSAGETWAGEKWADAGSPVAAASGASRVVHVPLPGRAYDIRIGRGEMVHAGAAISRLLSPQRAVIVSDDNVWALHGARLHASLEAAGIVVSTFTVPAGEASKSYARLAEVCDAILAARAERKDVVVALGGGVVGDLAGFAAATVRRGMPFVQIPTSLLAQVDSSVGGKTGINSSHGKNLVGAFHQPGLVICDTALIDTLPLREKRAGYAEIVKYGLIDKPDFFAWCERNWQGILDGGEARDEAVAISCAAKAEIVVRDEREDGDRALLNLGHTFAHAFERMTHYDGARLVHGEAVAIGLALAFRFSAHLGLGSGQDASRVAGHLRSVGLPTRIADVPGAAFSAAAIVEAMHQDKKVSRGALTFILARGIGESFIARGIEAALVSDFLERDMTSTDV